MTENPKEQTVDFEKKEEVKVKASDNKAKDIETKPIDRVDIEKKIKTQQNDVEQLRKRGQELIEQRKNLNAEIGRIEQVIIAKEGAIAGLQNLLET